MTIPAELISQARQLVTKRRALMKGLLETTEEGTAAYCRTRLMALDVQAYELLATIASLDEGVS